MKARPLPGQCQGFCQYYWDGAHWTGPADNCVGAGCVCAPPPPPPPPNTPPFVQFVQCVPTAAQKSAGKRKPPSVRIHVTEDVDLCLIRVPGHVGHEGSESGKPASHRAKPSRKKRR